MVVEQVYFIDVEDAPIGGCQHARLELALAFLNGLFDIEGAHDAILGRAHRQVDKGRVAMADGDGAGGEPFLALIAEKVGPVGVAIEPASLYDLQLGQQGRQGARRSGFGRATLATDQHAADLRVDGIEDERSFHALLADDCRERIGLSHGIFLRRAKQCFERELPPAAIHPVIIPDAWKRFQKSTAHHLHSNPTPNHSPFTIHNSTRSVLSAHPNSQSPINQLQYPRNLPSSAA
jgi:hypothetical protein